MALSMRVMAAVGFVAALALVGPLASAQTVYGFGTLVAKPDFDFTMRPSVPSKFSLCFVDDGDGLYNGFETLMISLTDPSCAKLSDYKDIRVSDSKVSDTVTYKAGTLIGFMDLDIGATLTPVPNTGIRYVDVDNSGLAKFSSKDTAYITVISGGAAGAPGVVMPGDFRINAFSPHPGGTWVQAYDADVNLPLSEMAASPVFLCMAPVAGCPSGAPFYSSADGYYINADNGAVKDSTLVDPDQATPLVTKVAADLAVEENDIRLVSRVPVPWGMIGAIPGVRTTKINILTTDLVAGNPILMQVDLTNGDKVGGSGLIFVKLDGVLVHAALTPAVEPGKTATMILSAKAAAEPGVRELEVGDLFQIITLRGANGETSASDSANAALEARVAALEAIVRAQNDMLAAQSVKDQKAVPGLDPMILIVVGLVTLAFVRRRTG